MHDITYEQNMYYYYVFNCQRFVGNHCFYTNMFNTMFLQLYNVCTKCERNSKIKTNNYTPNNA